MNNWTIRKKKSNKIEKFTFAEPMSFLLAASLIALCTLFSSLWTSKKTNPRKFFLDKKFNIETQHQKTPSI